MTAPRSLPGCTYAMRPITTSAAPESTTEWKVTVQQVSGNVQMYSSGYRGRAAQNGLNLYLYSDGRATNAPLFATRTIRMAASMGIYGRPLATIRQRS